MGLFDFFDDLKCDLYKANPLFWQGVLAVSAARANGLITDINQCKQLGAQGDSIFGGGLGIIGAGTDCVCEYVFSQATPPPIPFQKRLLETATTFAPEIGHGTWQMADYDPDGVPDLVFIKTSSILGNVEVHVASAKSDYQTRIKEAVSTFAPEGDAGVWIMQDYDGDGMADLVLIKRSNVPGNVEVHIASGASDFNTRILETPTTFAAGDGTSGTWLMADYDRDGIPDLVLVKTANIPGKVEVHIASGSSDYQTRIKEAVTTFDSEDDGVWQMADYDGDGIPDLIFIKTSNVPGNVEVHIASGSSDFNTRIMETATTFAPESSNNAWLAADYDRDGVADLVLIKLDGVPGNAEVHIAAGA